MDFLNLQKSLESLIDWIIGSDSEEVANYINQIRSDNPEFNNRQICDYIVDDQALNSGLLGALTGLGGLITLPATVPIDLVKAWKIQAFTIRCIACVYGYTPENADLKTDIFLVLSNGSLGELKKLVIAEAMKAAPKHALKALDAMKQSAIQATAKQSTKYAAKVLAKYGGKTIVNYSMKGISKHLIKALWKVGGRKAVEKSIQKSFGKAIPVIGAAIGGGMDWFTTQAAGKLAIEYYENSVSDWVADVFGLCEEKGA